MLSFLGFCERCILGCDFIKNIIKKVAVAFAISLFLCGFAVPVNATDIVAQTVTAYAIEGTPYLEEGYAVQEHWQKDYDAKTVSVQSVLSELSDMKDYLSGDDRAKLDNIDIENFTYIEELVEYDAELQRMKEEALAAKERQLQQQKEAEKREAVTYYTNGSGLTRSSGVNYFGSRKETYYSSRVLRHYRTSEWTIDAEGFYKTSDGYYVVAASDLPQGSIINTSKGAAKVLDSGCAAGVTDFYVSW